MPAFRQFCTSSEKAFAVMAMMGIHEFLTVGIDHAGSTIHIQHRLQDFCIQGVILSTEEALIYQKNTQCNIISSAKIPYPRLESCTNTCVTAPMSFPSCKIGLPLMPCTMPPVAASRSGSVTVMRKRVHPPS
mgnify:FL=1